MTDIAWLGLYAIGVWCFMWWAISRGQFNARTIWHQWPVWEILLLIGMILFYPLTILVLLIAVILSIVADVAAAARQRWHAISS